MRNDDTNQSHGIDPEEEDAVDLGDVRHGQVLVCHGDDWPDQWQPWLEDLVGEFEELLARAEELDVPLREAEDAPVFDHREHFCDAIGVMLEREFREGCCTSGYYRTGWIPEGDQAEVEKKARELLVVLRQNMEAEFRRRIVKEIEELEDIDELAERVWDRDRYFTRKIENLESRLGAERAEDDRRFLAEREKDLIAQLAAIGLEAERTKAVLRSAEQELQATRKRIHELKSDVARQAEANTSDLDSACAMLACAVMTRQRARIVAGPLVLWDDGVVYAIISQGGVPLPMESTPAILLETLERIAHPVVTVVEQTEVGRWTSGPHYKKGSENISGWRHCWSEEATNSMSKRPVRRSFTVTPPEFRDRVETIMKALLGHHQLGILC